MPDAQRTAKRFEVQIRHVELHMAVSVQFVTCRLEPCTINPSIHELSKQMTRLSSVPCK